MAPIPNYAQMQTLRKVVITENLEQINAFPCLASIDKRSIFILSDFGCIKVSSLAAACNCRFYLRYALLGHSPLFSGAV